MAECCKRWHQRVYYSILTAILVVITIIQLVVLGTFGVQFSRTESFWNNHVSQDTSGVCVLYGKNGDGDNPSLDGNASCGFSLWAMVTVVLVLIVWIVVHIIMAIIGKPRISSWFRIADLSVSISMGFLSMIISSVLTEGLLQTCGATSFPDQQIPCSSKLFHDTTDTDTTLGFYGSLSAAMDTSWTVTVLFAFLTVWYIILVISRCCVWRCGKDKDDSDTKDKKPDTEKGDIENDTENGGKDESGGTKKSKKKKKATETETIPEFEPPSDQMPAKREVEDYNFNDT